MFRCRLRGFGRIAGVTGVALALVFAAFDAGAAAQAPATIDPAADQVLRAASSYLTALDAFVVAADVTEDGWVDDELLAETHRVVQLAVRRPDRMWAESRGGDGHRSYWYDGDTFTLMDLQYGTYAEASAPDSIDAMLAAIAETYDVHTPLADLAYSDLYATLTQNATRGLYLGVVTIDGVEQHHLAFVYDGIEVQLLIRAGNRPLPSRIVIVYSGEEGRPRFTADLSGWDTNPSLPDESFRFTAPPGATAVEMMPLLRGDGRQQPLPAQGGRYR